jgi:hypothetical protein
MELCCQASTPHVTSTTFLGTSAKVVMPPMGGALITSLRRAFLSCKSRLGLSCQQLRRLLHINRFDTRTLGD